MGKGLVLMLLLGSVGASAQTDHRTYPDRFNVCSDPNNCIVVTKQGDGWMGLVDDGTKISWNFQIDDFRMKYLRLTGVSTEKDSKGRNQVLVIQGKPDIIRDGIARCKARYTIGHKSTSRKVTVTWQPPPWKIPRIGH
jgi:hypothetical protein